jgi:hypothetical protein
MVEDVRGDLPEPWAQFVVSRHDGGAQLLEICGLAARFMRGFVQGVSILLCRTFLPQP